MPQGFSTFRACFARATLYKTLPFVYNVPMNILLPPCRLADIMAFLSTLRSSELGGNELLTVDFSQAKVVTPLYMLTIGIALRHLGEQHELRFVGMRKEEHYDVEAYARRSGFFHFVQPQVYTEEPAPATGTILPVTRLYMKDLRRAALFERGDDSDGAIIDRRSKKLAAVLAADSAELCDLLGFSIREILRNSPEHGRTEEMWLAAQRWTNKAEITLMDEGVGIFASLCSNPDHAATIRSNAEALRWAIKPGISQSFSPNARAGAGGLWANSGFGLHMICRICSKLPGSKFLLASYGNYISMKQDGTWQEDDTDFRGTLLRITLPTQLPKTTAALLDEARTEGEQEAATLRNAFTQASAPSGRVM